MERGISDKNLRRAYIQSAHIVARYGSHYLPIFERLENEYNQRIKENDSLTKAKKISKSGEIECQFWDT